MPSVARADLEALLRARKLDTTLTSAQPSQVRDEQYVVPTGIDVLDAQLLGGVARGQISEIVGPRSSGRTSVLVSMMAGAASRGELVALVDGFDTFDPPSAHAAGLDLTRLLWVRGEATCNVHEATCNVQRATCMVHPAPGTRHEATCNVHPAPGTSTRHPAPGTRHEVPGPWHLAQAIDRAVKAFGLILQAGGFGLVVLDLADAPHRAIRRLPFTTWLRLHRPIEGSATAAVIVAEAPVARSAGGVTMAVRAGGAGGAGGAVVAPGASAPGDPGPAVAIVAVGPVEARLSRARGPAESCRFEVLEPASGSIALSLEPR